MRIHAEQIRLILVIRLIIAIPENYITIVMLLQSCPIKLKVRLKMNQRVAFDINKPKGSMRPKVRSFMSTTTFQIRLHADKIAVRISANFP